MAMEVVNDYESIPTEWFLGDIGSIDDWASPTTAMPGEFDPQKARLFLEYLQIGMTYTQACLEIPIERKRITSWRRGSRGAPDNFRDAFTMAREEMIDAMADDVVDIADGSDSRSLATEQQSVNAVDNPFRKGVAHKVEAAVKELANRTGNRMSARKWYVSKIMPNRYGDKVQLDHGNAGGKALKTVDLSKLSDTDLDTLVEIDQKLNG